MSEDITLEDNSPELSPEATPEVAPMIDALEPTSTDDSFITTLPEELRNEASLGDFKDVGALAKSYVSAQRMLGGSLRIPSEDASDEAREAFYKSIESVEGVVKIPSEGNTEEFNKFYSRLGRPETAAGYELTAGDMTVDQDAAGEYKELAYNLGLSKQQAQSLFDFEVMRMQTEVEGQVELRKNCKEILTEKWGDAYDTQLSVAKSAMATYAEQYPDLRDLCNNPAVGNNPAFIGIMAELGSAAVEGQSVPHADMINAGVTLPENAIAQIKEMRDNKQHPVNNPTDRGHQAAKVKLRKLYEAAYSNDPHKG